MSEEVKSDPAAEQVASSEPKLQEDLTKRVTDDVTDGSKNDKSVTEKVSAAATTVKSDVFSMFGGGPKKEKVEDDEGKDEPSGSSKAQKAEDVCEALRA